MSISEKLDTIASNQTKVYEAGKKAEYDAFWDMYQQNGNRTDYRGAFSRTAADYPCVWTKEMFKPKYPMHFEGSGASSLFYYSTLDIDLTEFGVPIDFSKATSVTYILGFSSITGIGVVDTTSCDLLNSPFAFAYYLKSIGKLKLRDDGSQTFSNTIHHCYALENLTIEGTIGQKGFNVQHSTKLSKASITSIINALSATTDGLTVTLSKTAVNNAFGGSTSEEWIALTNTKTNWTISLL